MSIPTTWSLQRWVTENPWESEDGPTKLDTCARNYYWDHAAAWIDETSVAVGGIGDDDTAMVDGVRLFDITATGSPGGPWRADWRVASQSLRLRAQPVFFLSDGVRLFSSDSSGLSRWDLETGARPGDPTFQPTRHHRGAGELAQIADGALVRWTAG